MRESITPQTEFNTFCMLAQEIPDLFLYVEGEDDEDLLRAHAAPGVRIRRVEGGKPASLEFARLAEDAGAKRVRVLVDRDFDFREGAENSSIVLRSDSHDIFMDIVSSSLRPLNRVIENEIRLLQRTKDEKKSRKAMRLNVHDVMSRARDASVCVAAVRSADAEGSSALNFHRVRFDNLVANPPRVHDVLSQLGVETSPATRDEINQRFLAAVDRLLGHFVRDAYRFIGDHDLFGALAAQLRRGGSKKGHRDLQRDFILAVRCDDLRALAWFGALHDWSVSAGVERCLCDRDKSCDV